jgi:pyridoxamine 5'-phosphate oxidase
MNVYGLRRCLAGLVSGLSRAEVPLMNTFLDTGSERLGIGLYQTDLDPNPIKQFSRWFQKVIESDLPEPNAMTLATSSKDGVPTARVVLLKAFDERGFVFYTNLESQKGKDLAENPRGALVFFWAQLQRQVRITGVASRVPHEEAEAYFHTRPIGSQIGAWASQQSRPLSSREQLDECVVQFAGKYAGQPIPLPPFWGGYCLRPESIEFWQNRPNRLHDRFLYTLAGTGEWKIERLFP